MQGPPNRPALGFARVTVLALPAERVVVTPQPARMLAGTSLVLDATADLGERGQALRRGHLVVLPTRRRRSERDGPPHRAARPARRQSPRSAGGATLTWRVVVGPNSATRIGVAPGDTTARTGDVIRFRFAATDAARRPVADARSGVVGGARSQGGGTATIDGDGVFVANDARNLPHRRRARSAIGRSDRARRGAERDADGVHHRSPAAQEIRSRRAVAASRRQARLHLHHRRSHLRDRHLRSGQAVPHRFGRRGRSRRERRHDDGGRQVRGDDP